MDADTEQPDFPWQHDGPPSVDRIASPDIRYESFLFSEGNSRSPDSRLVPYVHKRAFSYSRLKNIDRRYIIFGWSNDAMQRNDGMSESVERSKYLKSKGKEKVVRGSVYR